MDDVIMWQETKLQADKISLLRSKWGQDVYMACFEGASRRGVVTLFADKLEAEHLDVKRDAQGQFLLNVCNIKEITYLFANVYGDPGSDADAVATFNRVADAVNEVMNKYNIHRFVMGGDFNLVLEDNDAVTTTRKPNAEDRLRGIIEDMDVYDVAQELARNRGGRPSYTYFRRRREQECKARYDRIYVSPMLMQGAKIEYLKRIDDHVPVRAIIQKTVMGSRQWRFDDALLQDAMFQQKMQDKIKEVISAHCEEEMSEVRIQIVQEHVKEDVDKFQVITEVIEGIREMAEEEMKKRKEERRKAHYKALDEMIAARDVFNSTNAPTEEQEAALDEATMKLKSVQNRRAGGAAEMNKLRYATEGERVTSYHFSLMKRGRPGREIRNLNVSDNGAMRSIEGADIVEYMTNKYEEIAKKDNNVGAITIQEYLGDNLTNEMKKCSEDVRNQLEEELTGEELDRIVAEVKQQSAPGPKGITNKLMKYIFPFIRKLVVQAGNKWLFGEEETEGPEWLGRRKVIFIPKPKKDRADEDSYRGLSMLEGFYKIFAKALANRMARALEEIQDRSQFGFTKGKGTLEASRTVIDAVEAARRQQVPMIVIFTDLYKAFDTVDQEHIKRSFEVFKFPQKFQTAYNRLTKTALAQYEVNSMLSRQVKLERGTGQGDPMSSFLFNLAATPLNIFLSESPNVPRLRVNGRSIAPVYFADDNAILLSGTQLAPIMETIDKIIDYEKVAGLKLNLRKCDVMTVNCEQDLVDELIRRTGMKLVTKARHLGLTIENTGELKKEDNLKPIIEKMNQTNSVYNTSLATPIGRSLYAKFLLGSRYVHVMSSRATEEEEMKQLRESVLKMTWTKSRNNEEPGIRTHIAKTRVAQKVRYGGMSLPDPKIQDVALRLVWVRKFANIDTSLGWYQMLVAILEDQHRPDPVTHMKLGHNEWEKTSKKIENKNRYWSRVFKAISEIIQATNSVYKQWQLIPLIGSCDENQEENIGSLTYSNPQTHLMLRNGLICIGQIFHTNEAGQIMPNRPKTFDELQDEFRHCLTIMVYNSIMALKRVVLHTYRQKVQSQGVGQENKTPLELLVTKYPTGCSAATEVLLAKERQTWTWGECPRAHHTYAQDGLNDITQKEYSIGLERIRNSLTLPAQKWTASQIMLRTLWTAVKEARTRRGEAGNEDGMCKNCRVEEEVTRHLMYDCIVAQEMWVKVYATLNTVGVESASDQSRRVYPVNMNIYQVLFYKLPQGLQTEHRKDFEDVVTVAKHGLYKLRLRRDSERRPTNKRVIMELILDLEVLMKTREKCAKNMGMLPRVIQELRSQIGWN